MNERIKLLRHTLKLTQKEFAKQIGLSHATLSDIEKNKVPIQNRHIITICHVFNVNEKWLLYGDGDMFIIQKSTFKEFMNIFNELSPTLQEFLLNIAKELLKVQDDLK